MKTSFRRFLILALCAAVTVFFTSCPLPITDALVAAIEDQFAPIIAVTSPNYGDTYYSEVTIEGVITDHAITAEDGKGSLSLFSFAASSLNEYRGGIRIDSSGNVEPDTALGSVPIAYDPSSGLFSFTMNTSGYYGTMQIDFRATDLNGNSSGSSFQLKESSGPLVMITSPADPQYTQGQVLHVEGTLQDSLTAPASIEEIRTLTCTIQELGVFGTNAIVLDVDNDLPEIIFHSSKSQGFDFILNRAARVFSADVDLPDSFSNTITIIVTVEDKNGKSSSPQSMQLSLNTGEALISFIIPGGAQQSYYSPACSAALPIEVWVDPGAYPLIALNLRVQSSTRTENISFLPSYNAGTMLASRTIDLTGGHSGNAVLTMTATTSDGVQDYQTSLNATLYEDAAGPQITDIAFAVGDGDAWARSGDTAALQFRVTDSGAGFTDNLTTAIADSSVTAVKGGDGIWRASLVLPGGLTEDHDDVIPFEIAAADILGNLRTADQTAVPAVDYYHGVPSVMPTVNITKTTSVTASNWLSESEILTVSLPTSRDLAIDADDFQLVFNGTLTRNVDCRSGYTGTCEIQGDEPNGAVTFNWHYLDKAGNETTYTGKATVFVVDNTPPIVSNTEIVSSYTDNTVVPDGYEARVRFSQADSGGSGMSGDSPTVDFYVESVYLTSLTAAYSSGYWRASYTAGGLTPQGTMTAVVRTGDAAGNTTSQAVTSSVEIDSLPPTVSDPDPGTAPYYTNTDIEVSVTASDNDEVSGVTIGGAAAVKDPDPSTTWRKTLTLPASPTDPYTITAVATDGHGNFAESSIEIAVVDP